MSVTIRLEKEMSPAHLHRLSLRWRARSLYVFILVIFIGKANWTIANNRERRRKVGEEKEAKRDEKIAKIDAKHTQERLDRSSQRSLPSIDKRV